MLHCLSELNSNLQYLVYFQNRLRSYFVLGTQTIPGSNEEDPVSVCLFKLKDINCFNSFIWRFDFSISHGQIIYRLVKSIFFSITLSLSRFPSGGLYTTSQFLKLQQTQSIFMISIHLKHLAIFRNFFLHHNWSVATNNSSTIFNPEKNPLSSIFESKHPLDGCPWCIELFVIKFRSIHLGICSVNPHILLDSREKVLN